MKSILVAVSGTSSDISVLNAALAAPLRAHLDFVHIPLTPIESADSTLPFLRMAMEQSHAPEVFVGVEATKLNYSSGRIQRSLE
jgi:hypothetical protein